MPYPTGQRDPPTRRFATRPPGGFVEGLNNKIRAIQRRAHGFRDEEYLRLKILTCMFAKTMKKGLAERDEGGWKDTKTDLAVKPSELPGCFSPFGPSRARERERDSAA